MSLVGRTFITPHKFKHAKWSLGRFSRPLNFIAFIWNLYLACVLFSPLFFPVTAETFNCKVSDICDKCIGSSLAYRFACHFWSNYHLRYPLMVVYTRGEVASGRETRQSK